MEQTLHEITEIQLSPVKKLVNGDMSKSVIMRVADIQLKLR